MLPVGWSRRENAKKLVSDNRGMRLGKKVVSFSSFMLTSDSRHHREAINDSERTRVVQKGQKQEKVTEVTIAADDDSSKTTASKQEGSVVSALLATACVAAVAIEAVAESRQKERPERAEVKLDNRYKIGMSSDRDDSLVCGVPARIIEDKQTVTNMENVAVTRTAQQIAMVDMPVSQKNARTPATIQVSLGDAETKTRGVEYVG